MSELLQIREEPISVDEVMKHVSSTGAGAIATFVGAVRDHNDGRAVTLLEYQAYRTMAEKQMRRIAEALTRENPGVRVAALHRVGALAVGDIAVVCAVSSAHRGAAFEVCRAFIDRIKGEVPIWKREHGPDGPYWVGWEDARCAGHAQSPQEAK
jgi:molybdopterin synthase catalytic subunit